MYAIVDIETTGGYAASNGITEIAILLFDGQQIIKRYETLINPGKPIPRFIQSFTGITDEMVSTAPEFNEVAQEIFELLNDSIFVAHNVNFDYSFVKHHLAAEGLTLQTKKLCTVRLARKILPGYNSYSLGNLCNRLNIPIYARHRAMGDAAATAQLFQFLLEQDSQNQIEQSLQKNSKEQSLPLNLPAERLFELPKQPGVYYFYNKEGKVIYVGKARNLRKRVNSHFTNNNTGKQRQQFLQYVYDISYETCGTELMAVILESAEIKRLWPEFNRSQKNYEPAFGIYDYQGQDGYLRLGIDKIKPNIIPLCTFRHYSHALEFLQKCVNEYELCPKLSGVQDNRQRCIALDVDQCKGACMHKENKDSYNSRIQLLIDELDSNKPTYIIKNAGRTIDEEAMLLVENGKFYGMGYVSRNTTLNTVNEIKDYLVPLKENEYIRHLINRYADKHPEMIYSFTGA